MATPALTVRRFFFDVFELDLRAGELRKRGTKLRLQGQPLEVLATLLSRAGDVVTREELRSKIWTADTFVDFDHSLHNAIARVREVLGDSVDSPRYIETLPRRGYRFIAPVSAGSESTPFTEAGVGTGRNKLRVVSAVALLAFVAVGGLWLMRKGTDTTSAAGRLRSIAVLPLDNLSGDASQD